MTLVSLKSIQVFTYIMHSCETTQIHGTPIMYVQVHNENNKKRVLCNMLVIIIECNFYNSFFFCYRYKSSTQSRYNKAVGILSFIAYEKNVYLSLKQILCMCVLPDVIVLQALMQQLHVGIHGIFTCVYRQKYHPSSLLYMNSCFK